MRNYVAQKQKQLIEQQSNFYTPTGIHVYFKDQLSNHKVDIERVVNKVENKIPEHLLSNVEMIIKSLMIFFIRQLGMINYRP